MQCEKESAQAWWPWRWGKEPWANDCGWPLEARKGKKAHYPLEPPESKSDAALHTLDFRPVKHVLDFWPPELHESRWSYHGHVRVQWRSKLILAGGLRKLLQSLASVAQWIEHQPANQKVAGSIPSQGTCLGCRPGPQLRACERQLIHVSLPVSLLFLLSKNK